MARPGKEQLFLVGTGVVLAWLTWSTINSPHVRINAPSGKKADEGLSQPAWSLTGPQGELSRADWRTLPRDPFQEPREWHPLPAANLARPPLREPAMVPPMPMPAVGLAQLGVTRVELQRTPHEFAELGVAAPAEEVGADPTMDADQEVPDGADALDDDDAMRTLEQEYRRRFDWLEVRGSSIPWWGIIKNEDKYSLAERAEEDVLFARMDPETKRVMVDGTISRASLKDNGIHLADNPANRVELKLREVPPDTWTPGIVTSLLRNMRAVMAEGREDPYAWQRAAEVLTLMLDLDALSPGIYELLADCHREQYDYEAELRTLQLAEERNVDSGGLRVRRARWAWRYGARRYALDLLDAGVTQYTGNRELHLYYGECLLQEGRLSEAQSQFSAAEQSSTTPGERRQTLRRLGDAYLAQGRLEDAANQARRILEMDANDLEGLALQGAVQFASGDTEAAARSFGQLTESADRPALRGEALLGQGLSMARNGDFDTARDRLLRAGQIHPLLQAQAEAGLAFLNELTGHDQEALDHATRALERDPDNPFYFYLLGRLQRRAGDVEGAHDSLREALHRGASFPDLFNELAFVSLWTDQAPDAVRYAQESLAREDRAQARLLLGHALLQAGETSQALQAFGRMQPGSESFLGMAWCSYRLGRVSEAVGRLDAVVNEMPDAPAEDREYAQGTLALILDLESKERWGDSITWREVGNGWTAVERYGLDHRAVPGDFTFKGRQRSGTTIDQWTWLERPVELQTFHDLEMTLQVKAGHQGRTGVGLVVWGQGAGQEAVARISLALARETDGTLVVQARENVGDPRAVWRTVEEGLSLPAEVPFRLGLRRMGPESENYQLLLDGVPVGEPVPMPPWRGRRKMQLSAVFFSAAEPGKNVEASMTEARIIRYRSE